jgi:hypothetical protein
MFKNRIELTPKVYYEIEFWRNYLFDNYKNSNDFQYRVNLYRSLWRCLNQLSPLTATEVLDDDEYLITVDDLFKITYLSMISLIDNVSFIYVTNIDFLRLDFD